MNEQVVDYNVNTYFTKKHANLAPEIGGLFTPKLPVGTFHRGGISQTLSKPMSMAASHSEGSLDQSILERVKGDDRRPPSRP